MDQRQLINHCQLGDLKSFEDLYLLYKFWSELDGGWLQDIKVTHPLRILIPSKKTPILTNSMRIAILT